MVLIEIDEVQLFCFLAFFFLTGGPGLAVNSAGETVQVGVFSFVGCQTDENDGVQTCKFLEIIYDYLQKGLQLLLKKYIYEYDVPQVVLWIFQTVGQV